MKGHANSFPQISLINAVHERSRKQFPAVCRGRSQINAEKKAETLRETYSNNSHAPRYNGKIDLRKVRVKATFGICG